jgi:hypothetical protein
MHSPDVSWHASAQLRRVGWLLHAHLVETKLRRLAYAVKYNFDPNQPRVPAGRGRESGRWADAGGSGGGTRIAQNVSRPRSGSGQVRLRNGQLVEATPGQEARLAVASAQAAARSSEVRQLDPNWRPTPSLTETVEGEILAAEAEAREAEARLQELSRGGIGPGPFAGESIPARGPSRDFTVEERTRINSIGSETGCHTCGTHHSGTPSGNFVPDHQPPNALNSARQPQRLYPQCLGCSQGQGGWTRSLRRSR